MENKARQFSKEELRRIKKFRSFRSIYYALPHRFKFARYNVSPTVVFFTDLENHKTFSTYYW